MDNGKAVRESLMADLPLAADQFRYFAGAHTALARARARARALTLALTLALALALTRHAPPGQRALRRGRQ